MNTPLKIVYTLLKEICNECLLFTKIVLPFGYISERKLMHSQTV